MPFIYTMKCSHNQNTELTSAQDRDEGAREGQTRIVTQSEVHTVGPGAVEGPSHGQQARVAHGHLHGAADRVLGELAGGVRNDGTDLGGNAEGVHGTEREREG